jgi:surface protein
MVSQWEEFRQTKDPINCFNSNKALRQAVEDYVENNSPKSPVVVKYGDISKWCVDFVKDFSYVFADLSFNQPISGWDTRSATTMKGMFLNNVKFNQEVGFLDTSNVVDTSQMFAGAKSFEKSLAGLNLTNVKDLSNMFNGAISYQEDLCDWGFVLDSSVKVQDMFVASGCSNKADPDMNTFPPGPFCNTCVYKPACFETNEELRELIQLYVTDPNYNASKLGLKYGQNISDWCLKDLSDFTSAFSGLKEFNEPLTNWDTSSAIRFNSFFDDAVSFNQDLSHFDTSRVVDMRYVRVELLNMS